jgi:hypothetical protein
MTKKMRLINKVVEVSGNYNGIIDTELNKAILAGRRNGFGYREQSVYDDLASVEINSHVYPGDRYITADLYDSNGDGFQMIVRHETDRKGGYKPGDIIG